jgi:hypothetical protein
MAGLAVIRASRLVSVALPDLPGVEGGAAARPVHHARCVVGPGRVPADDVVPAVAVGAAELCAGLERAGHQRKGIPFPGAPASASWWVADAVPLLGPRDFAPLDGLLLTEEPFRRSTPEDRLDKGLVCQGGLHLDSGSPRLAPARDDALPHAASAVHRARERSPP